MNFPLQTFTTIVLLLCHPVHSRNIISTLEWHVNPSIGSDDPTNSGTDPSSPLRTIQRCIDLMVMDSEVPPSPSFKYESGVRGRCVLAEGEYSPSSHTRRGIVVEGLKGKPHAIYEIAPQQNTDGSIVASVTFVGYDQVIPDATKGWTYESGTPTNRAGPSIDHWRTTVTNDFDTNLPWQLFVNHQMQIPARWPDAKYDDDSIFSASTWAKTTEESIFRDDITQDSTVVEASGELASSGLNATGASAILNIKHWFTFTTVVKEHTPFDNTVVYRKQPGWKGKKWKAGSDIFFLENKAEFLSQENEWYYDKDSRQLMVALVEGKNANPTKMNIGLRVQEYAFRITTTTDFRLRDLKFIGTTIYAASTSRSTTIHGIQFDSLQFFYPSAMKRSIVGNHVNTWPTTLYEKDLNQPCRNKIFNCTFVGNEGHPTTHLKGSGLEINNNLFRKIDYTAVTSVPCRLSANVFVRSLSQSDPGICADDKYGSGGTALDVGHGTVSQRALVKRNTIDTYGGSSGLTVGKNVDVTLNRISGAKDIQLDGALIQAGGHDRYEIGEFSNQWEPPLCPSFETRPFCRDAGCTWSSSSQKCSGNPSESYLARPENQPPTEATDGSSWYGTHYSNNWIYDSTNDRASKRALRFDRAQDICNGRFGGTWANHGTITNNVAWNTQGIMVKGNGIETEYNTVFGTDILTPDSEGSNVRDLTVYDEFEEGTCNCSDAYCIEQPTTCCVTLADGTEDDTTFEGRTNVQRKNLLGRKYKEIEGSIDHLLPGTSMGNVAGPDALMQLRDIPNFDFRPKSKSTVSGAYEAEGDVYWIPGRKEWIPSSPIPPNNAKRIQLDADLMFLPRLARVESDGDEDGDTGLPTDTHIVYAACSPDQLDTDSAYTYTLTNGKNIVPMPEELARPGKTIYWRVDTQPPATQTQPSPSVLRGKVWEFTYIDTYSDINAPPAPPGRCRTYYGPQVNLADNEISSSVTTVSEITVDAKDYDTDKYTLVESKLCVNLKDATFGIQDLQLRLTTKGGFVMLKAQNQGVGNELYRTCFTDSAGSMIPKTSDGGSLFEGDWLPKSGLISDRVNKFPGTSGWARMMVKDHGAAGRDYTGLMEWSLELCFDGWEEPYNQWLEDEEERIRKKEEEIAKPWCTSTPVTPTDAPLTPPNTTDMPTTEPSPSPVASPTLPPTQKPTTAPTRMVPECTTTEGSVGKTLRLEIRLDDMSGSEFGWKVANGATGNGWYGQDNFAFPDRGLLQYEFCLAKEECWDIVFQDLGNDGICRFGTGEPCYYKAWVDGKEVVSGDGNFGSDASHKVCIGTKQVCKDMGSRFTYRKRRNYTKTSKTTCKAIAKKSKSRINKSCNFFFGKKKGSRSRVGDEACLQTCGEKGLGPCAFLKDYPSNSDAVKFPLPGRTTEVATEGLIPL